MNNKSKTIVKKGGLMSGGVLLITTGLELVRSGQYKIGVPMIAVGIGLIIVSQYYDINGGL